MYNPLSEPSDNAHVRILTLLPGTEAELQCRLQTCLLAEASSHEGGYEALSYCWETHNRNVILDCSESSIKITKTLDCVLRALRYSDKPRRLWIDQICINQDDDKEKSQQVRIMREIYSSAKRTLVWLGTDEEGRGPAVRNLFDLFFTLFQELGIAYCEPGETTEAAPFDKMTLLGLSRALDTTGLADQDDEKMRVNHEGPWFPTDNILQECGLPLRSSEAWPAFKGLLQSKYFTRIWTLQEVLNSRDVVILWGSTELPWATLRQAYRWKNLNHCDLKDPKADTSSQQLVKVGFLDTELRWFYGFRFRTLGDLVTNSRDAFEATNPKDQIFALISLASDGKDFTIDYNKTEEQVFTDFTSHVIWSGDLTMLNVAAVHGVQSCGLPSWVLNWRSRFSIWCDDSPAQTFNEPIFPLAGEGRGSNRGEKFMASGKNSAVQLRGPDKRGQLTLRGIRLDHAKTICTHKVLNDDGFNSSIKAQYNELFADSSSPFDSMRSMIRCMVPIDEVDFSEYDDILALLVIVSLDSMSPAGIKAPENANAAEIIRLATGAMKRGTASTDSRLSMPSDDKSVWFKSVLEYLHGAGLSQEEVTHIVVVTSRYWNRVKAGRFKGVINGAGAGRKLFITTKGYVGLGPAQMCTMDVVIIAYGGRTPYVLRPVRDTEEFTLVGDCYIQGLMHGEVVQTVPEPTVEWFCLV